MRYYQHDRPCPKCGQNGIKTQYDLAANVIKRHCHRCSYRWHELPLDADDGEALTDPDEVLGKMAETHTITDEGGWLKMEPKRGAE